jgi:hypothetical protein
MFGYFDDYPWIHIRLSKEEIISYARKMGIDRQIEANLGRNIHDYVEGMLNPHHINGLKFEAYRLEEFMNLPDVEVLNFSRSYEGNNLLTANILKELTYLSPEDLVAHGFELIFRVK